MGFLINVFRGGRTRSPGAIALVVTLILFPGRAFTLNPNLSIKEVHHTAWGPRDGAPPGGVIALTQSSDGYLWMVSPSGLYRFDGVVFERIAVPKDPRFSSMQPLRLFAPRRGGLWVSFNYGGLASLKNGSWHVYSADDGVPPGGVVEFADGPDGTLWVAALGGFARFDGTRWTAVGPEQGLTAKASDGPLLFIDGQGTIWAGASGQIFTLAANEHRFSRYPYKPSGGGGMAESRTGTIWHDEGTQVVPIHQNAQPHFPTTASISGPVIDHDGTLWVDLDSLRRIRHPESIPVGAVVRQGEIADTYTDRDGLSSNAVFTLLVDREGNVWAGTTSGLDRFSEPSVVAPMQADENRSVLPEPISIGVSPAGDSGGLWITDSNEGVYRYQEGRLAPPVLKGRVTSLLRADDGTVWFGGVNKFWHESNGRLEVLPAPVPNRDVQALVQDKTGGIWASVVLSGVFRLKDGSWTPFGGIAALPRDTPITIARDHRDRLWFSYPGGKLLMLEGERVSIYRSADGLNIGNITAIYPGSSALWLGGEFGLSCFDDGGFHAVRSVPELTLEGITGILESREGDLWLNTRTGIAHVTAGEVQRSRADPAYRVRGETLGAYDGIVGTTGLRPLPSAVKTSDGKFWFATSAGFYSLDPEHSVRNRVPPLVQIRTLTVGNRALDPSPGGLRLPVRTAAVRIDYIGLSLTAADKVRYRYRLDGVDSDWQPLTASRQALYNNLQPGNYTFHVIASNNDGIWNDQGASLAFVIPPAFAQTGWFLMLCVAAGAVGVWVAVRLRIRQITTRVREKLEERMSERERIARDLHDTLLQGIQGLVLRFQVATERIPKGEPTREMLDRALERADRLVDEGRARVKGLRAPVGGVPRLPQAIARIVEELAPADASPFRITVEGAVRELDPIVREELQLLAREALSNAYHHANASTIEAEIAYADDSLTVRIRDDGKGIDGEVLREGRRGHFGLLGMRERAEKLRARLGIWSKPGAGTEVEIRVPAAIAYRQSARSRHSRWWRKASAADREERAL